MLSYNKVCELEDFSHPDLKPVLTDIFFHEKARFGNSFPKGYEYRKYWEIAMSIRALIAGGAIHPASEILGVGAGNEPTVFYLTNHVRRVFATDLYLGEDWHQSANVGMFTHPERYWPRTWQPRKLIVQHMNALDLRYDDNSFDGIFSSSSLEHFGSFDDVKRSVQEMIRVLKPGGILTLSTEFRINGDGNGVPGILMFDESQIRELFFALPDLEPLSSPKFDISVNTRQTEQPLAKAIDDLMFHIQSNDEIIFHKLTWSTYPQILLRQDQYIFTSIHIALRKHD